MTKKYMVEFTASVTGSMAGRDDGQPYRTTKQGTDRIEMIRFYKKCLEMRVYGWQKPTFSEMEMVELDGEDLIKELELFEETKNHGGGI